MKIKRLIIILNRNNSKNFIVNKNLQILKYIIFNFFLFLLLYSNNLFAEKFVSEKVNIKVHSNPNKEIININLDKKYNINIFSLSDPYRLIVDLKKISINQKIINIEKINSKFIKEIRFGNPKKTFSRIVFEFNKPFIVPSINHLDSHSKKFKYKIQMEVLESTHTGFNLGKKVMNEKFGTIGLKNNLKESTNKKIIPLHRPEVKEKDAKEISLRNKSKKYIVFIDPGHGGKDPGAISPSGIHEKKITLKASLLLKKSLSKFKDVEVYLSRKNDRYLFLRERIKLAKKFKADIFISLHADASKNKKARGISVFSLSNKASDIEAKKLALRENKSDLIGSLYIRHSDPLIVGNLIKMFQRETMNQSAELAKYILLNLNEYALYSRGHRFAGFAVLKSPDIPSVLIELGFLTNKIDEKNLLNQKYLTKLCETISVSINKYIRNNIVFN